jgi:L-cysteine:1D-myo-inositol 2-amino-2-deoxy-alpha-D-glucopyranoside ligase
MRLYNTESARVEPLPTAQGGMLGLYVCGITPYDTTHLGHAFTYVVFDVLVRTLRATGRPVRYVQNVTDVDDDILKRARELNVSWDALARLETVRYQEDMAGLNVLAPDVFPRASETIPKIVILVEQLEAQGQAYARDGNVYFRVSTRPDYGRLSRLDRPQMIELSRQRGADPDDPRKEDPLDFVLWQRSQQDEPRWPSRWSEGRPGWHIECSAMALDNLGPQVDIHGGGADLVFPHHESEIAQSESVTGQRPFARTWMHVGMLRYAGQKMSKSLGNLVLVRDLLQTHDADSIRVCLLRHHYREGWEYRGEELDTAAVWVREVRRMAAHQRSPMTESAAIRAALEDDLDTPTALGLLRAAVEANEPGWRAGAAMLGLRLTAADSADAMDSRETSGREARQV